MDDESPTRAADLDSPVVTAGIRPQDALVCRMLNAAVRTMNGLHAQEALDFVLLGGDNIDSAQDNELRWVMAILDGSERVECDSGDDDEDNDGKLAFQAPGLDAPWRWMNGNHEVLVQGNLRVDDNVPFAVGAEARLGTRAYDGSGEWGTIVEGDLVVADDARRLLTPAALVAAVAADGDGHGLRGVDPAKGKATYAFDVPGTALTFVALDTSHANGGSEGVLTRSDVDATVKPLLDDALARGRLVVLASHHGIASLTSDGGWFGHAEPDALLPDDWRAFLAGYPNVVASFVGHAHQHRVTLEHAGAHAFWEVMTSALADFPHELRLVEIWDDDNGTLRIEATPVDFYADDDPPAALARTLGLIDILSGWEHDGRGAADARAVTLVVPKP